MEEVSVRFSNTEDHRELNQLKNQVHNYHASNRPDYYLQSSQSLTEKYYKELLGSGHHKIFVLEISDQIIAYAIVEILRHHDNPLISDHKRLFIEDICVDEKHRKMGIGTKLFKTVEAFCIENGISHIMLDVWNFNIDAINFYHQLGMKSVLNRMEKRL